MAEDSFQERTEQATPKREREAREKGQVPRSRELSTMAVLLVSSGGLLIFGPGLAKGLYNLMRDSLVLNRSIVMDPTSLYTMLINALEQALWLITPLLSVILIASLISSIAIGGVNFSTQALGFRLERLDPLKGLGRLFSMQGLMELAKAFVKFLIVSSVALLLLYADAPRLLGLGRQALIPAMAHAGALIGWGFFLVSAPLVLIAVVDAPFQIWQHNKQLRMTHQEVRDEGKETEGQPEVKRKQKGLQREISQQRMMADVARADVVVTNPTHYAVALRYDQEAAGAPRVVAKGLDLVAMRIRGLAKTHDVPVHSAPPLARALYTHTRLGEEIPAALYVAVAQLLAYVYQFKAGMAEPGLALDLSIPQEYSVSPQERL